MPQAKKAEFHIWFEGKERSVAEFEVETQGAAFGDSFLQFFSIS